MQCYVFMCCVSCHTEVCIKCSKSIYAVAVAHYYYNIVTIQMFINALVCLFLPFCTKQVGEYTWYHILAVDLDTLYNINSTQFPPSTNTKPQHKFPVSLAFRKDPVTNKVVSVIKYMYLEERIPLGPCGQGDFQYWSIAPVLRLTQWALFGELDKVVTVSETRFTGMGGTLEDVLVHLAGIPGETVNVAMFNLFQFTPEPLILSCKISSSGTAILHVSGWVNPTCN